MLFDAAGLKDVVSERDLVAIKLHFGERGNTTFVSPAYVKPIVEKTISCGGRPFLTDTGCLYFSSRANAREHLLVAAEHGFSPQTTLAPVLIADGLRGSDVTPVEVGLKHFDNVDVASGIHDANSLMVITHPTGHGLTGFAGTIKNLGMGAGGRYMKLAVHETVRPSVDKEKCDLCEGCLENCPMGAISVVDGQTRVDNDVCFGCGECMAICPSKAISVNWIGDPLVAQEKLAEITFAVLKNKRGRVGFWCFLINVTPSCDCWNFSTAPMVGDIGFLASLDPIAIDQAAADLVNSVPQAGEPEQTAPERFAFAGNRWDRQLEYGEELGLGTRDYELVKVGD
jgi:hypothetical protein